MINGRTPHATATVNLYLVDAAEFRPSVSRVIVLRTETVVRHFAGIDDCLVASKYANCHQPPHLAGSGLGLDVAWYRDVMRAKLVSLRLPRRLLVEYKAK